MFEFLKKDDIKKHIVNNISEKKIEKNFTINYLNIFVYLIFCLAGFSINKLEGNIFEIDKYLLYISLPVCYIIIVSIFPRWIVNIFAAFSVFMIMYWFDDKTITLLPVIIVIGAFMMPIIQIAKEWERAIILRLGKFKKVKGPGIFFLIPFIDSVADKVDIRTRVTDFVAETTLTKDSVTVTVDALCFWLVWDAEKAICEIENYMDGVVLSSLTALREAISMNDLSVLLEKGDVIEEHIRSEVEKKTTEWGITVSHIEITDIQIPEDLQDAMSKIAQAEREKRAKELVAQAEVEIAKQLAEAAKIYKDNPIALKLKKLSVINEGFKNGNSMVLVPSEVPGELNDEDVFGLKAMSDIHKLKINK